MTSRRRGLTVFAVGATAGAAACALLTTGVLAAGLGAAGRLVVPSAAAAGLPAFDDCEELRRWYVDAALPQVGPWGLGGGVVPMYAGAERSDAAASAPLAAQDTGGAVGSSGTGTNTQEADVDESDIAKTDGSLVVRISERELVVTDVSASRPRELSRTTLPWSPGRAGSAGAAAARRPRGGGR